MDMHKSVNAEMYRIKVAQADRCGMELLERFTISTRADMPLLIALTA